MRGALLMTDVKLWCACCRVETVQQAMKPALLCHVLQPAPSGWVMAVTTVVLRSQASGQWLYASLVVV